MLAPRLIHDPEGDEVSENDVVDVVRVLLGGGMRHREPLGSTTAGSGTTPTAGHVVVRTEHSSDRVSGVVRHYAKPALDVTVG